jgi:hypothetical protein
MRDLASTILEALGDHEDAGTGRVSIIAAQQIPEHVATAAVLDVVVGAG